MENNFLPVFSGGTGRSGTTLVGKILRNHSRIHAGNPYEIKFLTGSDGLLDLIKGLQSQKGLKGTQRIYLNGLLWAAREHRNESKKLEALRNQMLNRWWQRPGKKGGTTGLYQGFNQERLELELESLAKGFNTHPLCSSRRFFFNFISSHKDFGDSEFFVDTTPTNIEKSSQINELFLGSKFIHLVRDGRDTISSVIREPWGPKNPTKAIKWWKQKRLSAHEATEKLHPESILFIRMEDLVARSREESLEKILDFIGIENEYKLSTYFATQITSDLAHLERWKTDSLLDNDFLQKYEEAKNELIEIGVSV